jgi:hypothetical protein
MPLLPPTKPEEIKFEQLAALESVDAEQMSELKLIACESTIARMQNAASDDDEYNKLRQQITRGWPETPNEVDENLRPFYTFRDELIHTLLVSVAFAGKVIVLVYYVCVPTAVDGVGVVGLSMRLQP